MIRLPVYPLFASFSAKSSHVVNTNRQTFSQLLQTAAVIEKTFPTVNPGGYWLLALDDPFLFAAALIACWNHSLIPVISADTQPGTIEEIGTFVVGGFGDHQTNLATVIHLCSKQLSKQCREQRIQPNAVTARNADSLAIVMYTSGTTGKRKQVTKNFRQLFEEVKELQATFGGGIGQLPRFSTVSHLHIYSLLFNILWPLSFKGLMPAKRHFYWEEIDQLNHADGVVIVSSPAHLRFLPDVLGSTKVNWSKAQIFSSGAPLAKRHAHKIESAIGKAPTEVLGSTETGGIAWRHQSQAGNSNWRPFKNVKVTKDDQGILTVNSPYLAQNDQWISTGDGIVFDSKGHFSLTGRVDRVEKIAGKRVSLTEMEQHLLSLGGIMDVRVFKGPDTMERTQLAAVIQVDNTRAALFKTNTAEKKQQIQNIKKHLLNWFEPVTLPRKFIFLEQLPFDSQGKLPVAVLQKLVDNGK